MSNWIFLRGLMRESRHWGDFPAVFAEQIGGAHIVPADLPGNGRLHAQTSPTRVERMVDFYRHAIKEAGLTPPYHLLGLSLGAMVAVSWAQRFPFELSGCVLINTSFRPFSPFHHRLNWRNYPSLMRLLWHRDIAQRERLLLHLTSGNPGARARVVDDWIAYQREYPVSRRNALAQLAAAARFRAPAQKPAVPVLVLASDADRLVNPLCSQRLANAWLADFATHPDAGHDLPLDDGAWVATQVRLWLQKHTG